MVVALALRQGQRIEHLLAAPAQTLVTYRCARG